MAGTSDADDGGGTCECGAELPPVPDVADGCVTYHNCDCGREWGVRGGSPGGKSLPFRGTHSKYELETDEWTLLPEEEWNPDAREDRWSEEAVRERRKRKIDEIRRDRRERNRRALERMNDDD